MLIAGLSDKSILLLYAVLWGAGAVIGIVYSVSLKGRAAAGDHVVETDPEVDIPDHCVICGSPHAAESLKIFADYLVPRATYGSPHPTYMFRFCPTCAAPIRRRRKAGRILSIVGAATVVAGAIVLMIASPSWLGPPDIFGIDRWHLYVAAAFVMIGAVEMFWVGLLMWRAASGVAIFLPGQQRVLFRFTNQVFRNHFAEMNSAR